MSNGLHYKEKYKCEYWKPVWFTFKFRSFLAWEWETAVPAYTKWALLIFWSLGFEKIKSLFICGCAVITGMTLTAWAKGLGTHKKLKCKMVCYLMPERSVGTRCYLYAGNGLSHLGTQITDLLSFPPSLRYYWSFHYLVHTLSPQWLSSFSSARCIATKQLSSRHLIYPLTPILIAPYHHKHIIEFQLWLSSY